MKRDASRFDILPAFFGIESYEWHLLYTQ